MKDKKKKKLMTLDEALNHWAVFDPGMWENEMSNTIIKDWYAVCAEDRGIYAYFGTEADAYRFRLAEINRALNG